MHFKHGVSIYYYRLSAAKTLRLAKFVTVLRNISIIMNAFFAQKYET